MAVTNTELQLQRDITQDTMNQAVTAAVFKLWLCYSSSVQRLCCAWSLTGCRVCAGCVFSLTCSTFSLFITRCCTGEAEGQIFLIMFFLSSLFFWLYSAACIPASLLFPCVSSSLLVFTFLFFFYFALLFYSWIWPCLLPLLFSFFCLSHSFCILHVGVLDFVLF